MVVDRSFRNSATRQRRGKVRAILAGCAVLGVGAAVTLAAWTDSEWVWGGGSGDGDNIGTSQFDVQQNVWDGVGGTANFVDREAIPGGQLRFQPNATALTPGDTITAAMQLRTANGSDAAEVSLQGAVTNGSDADLFTAMTYAAYEDVSQADCQAQITGGGTVLVPPGSPLSQPGAATFTLAANSGSTMDLCFVLSLPADASDALQGLQVSPAWDFTADSV